MANHFFRSVLSLNRLQNHSSVPDFSGPLFVFLRQGGKLEMVRFLGKTHNKEEHCSSVGTNADHFPIMLGSFPKRQQY